MSSSSRKKKRLEREALKKKPPTKAPGRVRNLLALGSGDGINYWLTRGDGSTLAGVLLPESVALELQAGGHCGSAPPSALAKLDPYADTEHDLGAVARAWRALDERSDISPRLRTAVTALIELAAEGEGVPGAALWVLGT